MVTLTKEDQLERKARLRKQSRDDDYILSSKLNPAVGPKTLEVLLKRF